MKTITPPLLAALAAAVLTAGALELLHRQRGAEPAAAPTREVARAASEPAPSAAEPTVEPAALVDPTLRSDLEELSMRLTSIESRLASLERRPAAVPEVQTEPEEDAAAIEADPGARDFILSVVNEKQAAEEAEQRERMRAMIEDRLRERVSEMAAELGLSPHDENVVYDVLLSENVQRTELFDSVRREGFAPGSREIIRDQLGSLRDWKRDELTRQLGPDLAEQVLQQEPNPWARGRRDDGERQRRQEAGRDG